MLMTRKIIVVLLLIIFLFFMFRMGWKIMGLNTNPDLMETGSSKTIETPFKPRMEVLNEGANTSTNPSKVGSILINPGGVTSIKIESGYFAAAEE